LLTGAQNIFCQPQGTLITPLAHHPKIFSLHDATIEGGVSLSAEYQGTSLSSCQDNLANK